MTNVNNGWDNVGVEENGGNGGGQPREKLDFLTLAEGDTVIRIMDSAPHKYNEWWSVKGDGGGANGKGARIPYHTGGTDLLEKANNEFMAKKFKEADAKGLKDKARKDFLRDYGYAKTPYGKLKTKYVIHVIDRTDGTLKLLDGTGGIFEDIKKIAKRKGNPKEYDLVITREGLGFQDTKYTVIFDEKFDLKPEEIKLYEEKKIDLAKLKGADFCTPEQAKQVADGAKWADILENNSSDSEGSQEESNEDVQQGHTEVTPPEEKKEAPRKDEPVNIDKGEEMSEDELNDMDFE